MIHTPSLGKGHVSIIAFREGKGKEQQNVQHRRPQDRDRRDRHRTAERGGADGLALINTLLGMRIGLKTRKPVLANKKGGFSGRAVFPVALRMVYEAYEAVNIPIIGMGGVATAEDVLEMMFAGASAVEVGAENLVDPYACKKIIEDLPRVMQKYGVRTLSEIIGEAHK